MTALVMLLCRGRLVVHLETKVLLVLRVLTYLGDRVRTELSESRVVLRVSVLLSMFLVTQLLVTVLARTRTTLPLLVKILLFGRTYIVAMLCCRQFGSWLMTGVHRLISVLVLLNLLSLAPIMNLRYRLLEQIVLKTRVLALITLCIWWLNTLCAVALVGAVHLKVSGLDLATTLGDRNMALRTSGLVMIGVVGVVSLRNVVVRKCGTGCAWRVGFEGLTSVVEWAAVRGGTGVLNRVLGSLVWVAQVARGSPE